MGKQNRGKSLWNLPSHGRGTCPICGRTRVKVLYEKIGTDGKKFKVCKVCQKKK